MFSYVCIHQCPLLYYMTLNKTKYVCKHFQFYMAFLFKNAICSTLLDNNLALSLVTILHAVEKSLSLLVCDAGIFKYCRAKDANTGNLVLFSFHHFKDAIFRGITFSCIYCESSRSEFGHSSSSAPKVSSNNFKSFDFGSTEK